MKHLSIERLYGGILLAIFIGIIVHAPLTVWLGTLAPGYELVIKSWKELLMLLATPMAIILAGRYKLWPELWQDWLFKLIVVFVALHLLLVAVMWQGVEPSLAGLSIDLRWLLYFSLVYVAIRIRPSYRQLFIKFGLAGAVIVGVFALLQIFVLPNDFLARIGYDKDTTIAPYLTVDKNPDYVRINSTLRGPNPLGAYAVIVLSILITASLKESRRFGRYKIIALVTAIGMAGALWASYSRSALGAFAVSIGLVAAVTVGRRLSRVWWIAAVVIIFALAGGLFAARGTEFVSNVILHENLSGGSEESSNEGHVDSLLDGTRRMIEQPFGGGIGSTGSASLYGDTPLIIENQYLFIAHETGWLGLALFMILFVTVLVRLWHQRQDYLALGLFASGIGLGLIGLLLPVWVDDTVALIWWGLAGLAIGRWQIEDGVRGKKKGVRDGERTSN